MIFNRKDKIRASLKGIETGDAPSVLVVDPNKYIQHYPQIGDGLSALHSALLAPKSMQYDKNHRILAEGNFVLSVCEGSRNGVPASFYDLYRIAMGKIVEHWDTTEKIPLRSEWKNKNGKF